MQSRSIYLKLAAITLLGAILRFATANIGLTLDDACSAFVIEAKDLGELCDRLRDFEMSPPLYFLIARLFTAGNLNCVSMALPSILFGILTIPATFALACSVSTEAQTDQSSEKTSKMALLAALFAAISPLGILYSHEARAYALAGLLTTLTLCFFMRFYAEKVTFLDGALLFLTASALVYTHYTGIFYLFLLGLIAFVYAIVLKEQRASLHALLPLALALVTLAPWLPVLAYHRSFGTPWVDATPLAKFAEVFVSNLSAAMPAPVVASYLFLALLAPTIIALILCVSPKGALKALQKLALNPPLATLSLVIVISSAAFGYITPFKFGYIRYICPIASAFWVMLAALLVYLPEKRDYLKVPQSHSFKRFYKIGLALFLIAITLADILDTVALVSSNRSGMRKLAAEIAKRVKEEKASAKTKTVYITAPDFTGMSLVFYLKHEQNISAGELPQITGFACPESGSRWVKHEEDAACYKDPQLLAKYETRLDKLVLEGYTNLVFICDDSKPQSKLIPTLTMTNAFEKILKAKYKAGETRLYKGRATSYEVTEFIL